MDQRYDGYDICHMSLPSLVQSPSLDGDAGGGWVQLPGRFRNFSGSKLNPWE